MDPRLRELERHAADGDLHARVRLLRARCQAGDVDEAGLKLAAYLGDEAAWLALAPEPGEDERPRPPDPEADWGALADWLRGFEWGAEAHFRLCAAAARVAWRTWAPTLPAPPFDVEAALDAFEAWVLDRSRFPRVQRYLDLTLLTADVATELPPGGLRPFEAVRSLLHSARTYETADTTTGMPAVVGNARLGPSGKQTGLVLDAIRAELLAWSLGDSDPLRAPDRGGP